MVYTPELPMDNVPISIVPYVPVKKHSARKNHYISFMKYWMSNRNLLSAG